MAMCFQLLAFVCTQDSLCGERIQRLEVLGNFGLGRRAAAWILEEMTSTLYAMRQEDYIQR